MYLAEGIKSDGFNVKDFFNFLREKMEIVSQLNVIFNNGSEAKIEIKSLEELDNSFIIEKIKSFMVIDYALEFDESDSHGDNYFDYLSFFDGAGNLFIVSFTNSTKTEKKLFIRFDKYPK